MHRHGLGEAERHGQHRLGMPLHGGRQTIGIAVAAAPSLRLEQQQIECDDRSTRCRQLGERGGKGCPRQRPAAEPLQRRVVDHQNDDLVARHDRRPEAQAQIEARMIERLKRSAVVPAHIANAQARQQHRERHDTGPTHPGDQPPTDVRAKTSSIRACPQLLTVGSGWPRSTSTPSPGCSTTSPEP